MAAVLTAPPGTGRRITGLDTLRGACVILMTLFHLSYDLYFFSRFPAWVIFNPFMTFCQLASSWGFILLAGISSRLSRSNLKRGALVLLGGAAVSVITYLWGDFVRFGILQFLGCAMVLYGLTHRLWEKLPRRAAPVCYLVLFAVSRMALPLVMEVPHLYPFGIITPGFRSADYYPLFPWFFWFLFGTWLGGLLTEKGPPAWLSGLRQRQLAFLGRHALAAYFIHQPVLVALSAALSLLTGRPLPFAF
jgi:uncharacterized membrane protein